MKVTKFGHSCVLVETEDRVGLFDPGVWSDKSLIDAVVHLDRIIYTHEHPDHFNVEILRSIVEKFPQAHVICNAEIQKLIEEADIEVTVREESECTVKFTSPHEKLPIPGAQAPAENGYHFKDVFTAPGDSHSFTETKQVLAVAFVSPWGSVTDGVNKVIELKPEYVLPVHDWFYTDESREWLDNLLRLAFDKYGIKVLSACSGIVHEI